MKYYAKPLAKLISELSKLPGIGNKSAQRLAFHIINRPADRAEALAHAIIDAKRGVKFCGNCGVSME